MNKFDRCKVGQIHTGSGDNQSKVNLQITFYKQSVWWYGLISGILSSYLASWLWNITQYYL